MRVIDCDECGETLSAADDSELARQVASHYELRHSALEPGRAEALVAESAYDATDS